MSVGVHVCVCVHACVECMCTCVRVYLCLRVCVWLRVTVITDSYVQSDSETGDSGWCSLWTQYTGDLKTDIWDDPEIRTGSCSED